MPKPSLIGRTPSELEAIAQSMGQPAYRGRQLAQHLYAKAVQSFEEMRDLPAAFRTKLAEDFQVSPLITADHKISTDGVHKMLVHNGDGQVFECVLLPYEDRVSCCLSTQVGCPMGCSFCATGLGGFDRNLTTDEIIAQYLLLQSISERRISHVVYMGMGEPMLNFDSLVASIGFFHEHIGLSHRHITVSTVGLVPQIDKLAELKLPIHLALSLHSPLDDIRSSMMPVNHKWPVAVVLDAMRRYQETTGRKITIEYLLINGLNDTPEQAKLLAAMIKGVPSIVNVIPWNWVDTGNGYKRPSRERVRGFIRVLESRGVTATERIERGHDIAAACGQLAGQHQGKAAARRTALTSVPLAPQA